MPKVFIDNGQVILRDPETKKIFGVSEAEASEALGKGWLPVSQQEYTNYNKLKNSINVGSDGRPLLADPSGKVFAVDQEEVGEALGNGWRPTTREEELGVKRREFGQNPFTLIGGKKVQAPGWLVSGALGAGKGFTFGLSDYLNPAEHILKQVTDKNPELKRNMEDLIGTSDIRKARESVIEQNPGSHLIGDLAGTAGSFLAGPGVGVALGARAGGKGAAAIASKMGEGALVRATAKGTQALLGGALEGGAVGIGQGLSDLAGSKEHSPKEAMGHLMQSAFRGAALGGGVNLVGAGLGGLLRWGAGKVAFDSGAYNQAVARLEVPKLQEQVKALQDDLATHELVSKLPVYTDQFAPQIGKLRKTIETLEQDHALLTGVGGQEAQRIADLHGRYQSLMADIADLKTQVSVGGGARAARELPNIQELVNQQRFLEQEAFRVRQGLGELWSQYSKSGLSPEKIEARLNMARSRLNSEMTEFQRRVSEGEFLVKNNAAHQELGINLQTSPFSARQELKRIEKELADKQAMVEKFDSTFKNVGQLGGLGLGAYGLLKMGGVEGAVIGYLAGGIASKLLGSRTVSRAIKGLGESRLVNGGAKPLLDAEGASFNQTLARAGSVARGASVALSRPLFETMKAEIEGYNPERQEASIRAIAGDYLPEDELASLMTHNRKVVDFLKTKLPSKEDEGAFDRTRFGHYAKAAVNPEAALIDLAEGGGSRETIEALQVLYPAQLAEFREKLKAAIQPFMGALPLQEARRVEMILGEQVIGPRLTKVSKRLQAIFSAGGQGSPKLKSSANPTLAGSLSLPTDNLLTKKPGQ